MLVSLAARYAAGVSHVCAMVSASAYLSLGAAPVISTSTEGCALRRAPTCQWGLGPAWGPATASHDPCLSRIRV